MPHSSRELMKMVKHFKEERILSVIITVVLWLIYTITGLSSYAFIKDNVSRSYLYKGLQILFLWIFVRRIVYLAYHRKEEGIKRSILFSGIFLLVVGGIFVCVYPGTWSWDDVFIFTSAVHYDLNAWQHILTSVFHILCLETIPIAGSAPLFQILIASFIAGYATSTIGDMLSFGNKRVVGFIAMLPMLSPPLLSYLYSGFRMGICPYLELLLCVMFLRYVKEDTLKAETVLYIGMLTALVSAWRTENLYYIGIFVLFLAYKRKAFHILKSVAMAVCVTAAVLWIGSVNTKMIGTANYSVLATIVPMKDMIVKNALTKCDKKAVDKVLRVKFIKEYAQFSAEELYFMPESAARLIYTDEEWKEYRSAYIRSVLKHPDIAFRAMWDVFWKAGGFSYDNGMTRQRTTFSNTSGSSLSLFDGELNHSTSFLSVSVPLKEPLSQSLRNRVIRLLQGADERGVEGMLYILCWNMFYPLILGVFALYYAIRNRDLTAVVVLLSVFARFAVVFATAIAPYIMYYLSVYLIADVMFVYCAGRYIKGGSFVVAGDRIEQIATEGVSVRG